MTTLWWTTSFIGSNFQFSAQRARELARQGMKTIGDLWDHDSKTFRSFEDLSSTFRLIDIKRHHWHSLISSIPHTWINLLKDLSGQTHAGEWLGLFRLSGDTTPFITWINPNSQLTIQDTQHQQISILPYRELPEPQ